MTLLEQVDISSKVTLDGKTKAVLRSLLLRDYFNFQGGFYKEKEL